MLSVIIATDNRIGELEECLRSLFRQSVLPDEVIVAHGGSDKETEELIEKLSAGSGYKTHLRYYNFGLLGAARQRNKGAENACGNILFFLDDDIVCEPDFIKTIIAIFDKDTNNEIGGVSGTIVNQTYTPLSKINKSFFDLCLGKGERSSAYAGRLVGPAVNFLPVDKPKTEQPVD
ncbi:MAG: glycosyltransferase family A protein, partial [Candidatus Omnitrophota bacterium]